MAEYEDNAVFGAGAGKDDEDLGDDIEEDFGDEGDAEEGEGAEAAAAAAAAAAATTTEDPFELLHKYHPEAILDYAETVLPRVPLSAAPTSQAEKEKDATHTSPPFLTVYERTKILGTRANQIADGARPFVTVPEHVTQPLEIAKLELEQRRLPFIVKRPMPDGTFEYWRLSDLMIL